MPDEDRFHMLFEYAPISLWEEDYSGIRESFNELRAQGVTDLEAYLEAHPGQIERCLSTIRVRDVNQQTLRMFGAASKEQLLANLGKVFGGEMSRHFAGELRALWNGETTWTAEGVNYTLDGRPVDIRLHSRVLPGYEDSLSWVLVMIEDISARKQAEHRFQALFEAAPISLWQEDYSAIKEYLDTLRQRGVVDLEEYFKQQPGAVTHCMSLIKVLDVNRKTLELFDAGSKEQLLGNLERVFHGQMESHFQRELLDLWHGRLSYQQEGINYSLTGEPVNVLVDVCVMPGHEELYDWVQVAIQDITLRKKAESYLRYLGTHDVLTGVFNRAYFEEYLQKKADELLGQQISLIIADLNGLKSINDRFGHQAGDNLIRRQAEVLKAAFSEPELVARIGGDEFAILLLNAGAQDVAEAMERIRTLIPLNNKYYQGPELSIALGSATLLPGETLEKAFGRADQQMYEDKTAHYRRKAN